MTVSAGVAMAPTMACGAPRTAPWNPMPRHGMPWDAMVCRRGDHGSPKAKFK